MAGEATVKNDNERFVVALLPDGSVRRFNNKEAVPEGTASFGDIEELSKLPIAELDKISSKILKATIGHAKNKEEAVDRAWTALLAVSANVPADAGKKGARQPRVSNTTFKLLYDFDSPGKAEEKFKELPPQAQKCLTIMARGGKKEYPEAELRKLVEEHGKELNTVQEPWRIFQYYRNRLSDGKFIQAA